MFFKVFLFFSVLYLFIFSHHFISTGCIVSPLSPTCFGDSLDWARGKEHYESLSSWLEQWAKAGAGPNFRVENPKEFIQNFNWFPRWFEYYFTGKVFDQLLLIASSFLIVFFLFKKLKFKSKILVINKNILFFYGMILVIFLIWFTNHPQLRYGYSISFSFIYTNVYFFQNLKIEFFFEKKFEFF